ncbi:MAG: CvfB family protein [Lentisphaeria bacterium]
MLKIGNFNTLTVSRFSPHGAYLNSSEGEILMPNIYLPPNIAEGDKIKVFVYTDSEDRLVATTETPLATVDSFACLEVIDVNSYGAFLDWGVAKNLFVPFREQKNVLNIGDRIVVYIYLDEDTDRPVATTKIGRFINECDMYLKENDEVIVLVYGTNDVGYKVIVDQNFIGIIYFNECFQKLSIGEKLVAYVNKIRENDRIDLSLRRTGFQGMIEAKAEITEALKNANGSLPFTSKSSANDIENHFFMSKKLFKKAIGMLYKERVITITESSIELTK